MKLYKFLSKNCYALQALKTQTLKVSNFKDLNDPFELLAPSLEKKSVRDYLIKVKNRFAENARLLCFSRDYSSNLLWAHYANKHTGVALEIDVPGKSIEEVNYVSKRIELPIFEKLEQFMQTKNPAIGKELSDLLKTKSKEWEYEKEYRVIFEKEHVIKDEKGNEFLDLEKFNFKINGIVIGALNDLNHEEIENALPVGKSLRVVKARTAFRSFKIAKNLRKSPSTRLKGKYMG